MSPTLIIVVVNWNAGRQLRECISSIVSAKRDTFALIEVVVVDNGSTDGSLQGIDELALPVRIIRNEKNHGFAAACNQGALGTSSDYLLFLNPDTKLFDNSLSEPITFMQQPINSEIGICGIRLVDEQGNLSISAARFPTLRVMTGKVLRLSNLFPSLFPSHQMRSSDMAASGYVDQVIGAFFLIRKSVFDFCSGFDERFFVYFEEVDLSLRAKRLGYASFYLADISVFHRGGGCSEQAKGPRLFYSLRSRILYAEKHYSYTEFVLLILLTGVEFPLRVVQGIVRASWLDIKSTFSAYVQLIAYFLLRD